MSVLIKYCGNCGDEFDNYGMIILKDNEYKKLQANIKEKQKHY